MPPPSHSRSLIIYFSIFPYYQMLRISHRLLTFSSYHNLIFLLPFPFPNSTPKIHHHPHIRHDNTRSTHERHPHTPSHRVRRIRLCVCVCVWGGGGGGGSPLVRSVWVNWFPSSKTWAGSGRVGWSAQILGGEKKVTN